MNIKEISTIANQFINSHSKGGLVSDDPGVMQVFMLAQIAAVLSDEHLSLRDRFAIAAIQGMLSAERISSHDGFQSYKDMAAQAYIMADAMLTARENRP